MINHQELINIFQNLKSENTSSEDGSSWKQICIDWGKFHEVNAALTFLNAFEDYRLKQTG